MRQKHRAWLPVRARVTLMRAKRAHRAETDSSSLRAFLSFFYVREREPRPSCEECRNQKFFIAHRCYKNYFAIHARLYTATLRFCCLSKSYSLRVQERERERAIERLLFVYLYTSSPPPFLLLLSHFVSSALAAEEEEEKTKPTRTGEGSFAALT